MDIEHFRKLLLARIESGDDGRCMSRDEKIARQRLEIDPATPLCVRCAERAHSR